MALIVVIIVAVNAGKSSSSTTGNAAAGTQAAAAASASGAAPGAKAAATTAASAPAAARVVASFTGNGDENTAKFTVGSTWKLNYSFDCSDFGQAGNFVVLEDGGADFNGVSVNELALNKSGSSWAYNDAGSHYLQVVSECNWSLQVVDEG